MLHAKRIPIRILATGAGPFRVYRCSDTQPATSSKPRQTPVEEWCGHDHALMSTAERCAANRSIGERCGAENERVEIRDGIALSAHREG